MKILKFYTPTCMSCRVLGKILDKLENVEIEEVDATERLDEVDKYEICTTPTLIFLNDKGEETGRTVGMTTLQNIKELLGE